MVICLGTATGAALCRLISDFSISDFSIYQHSDKTGTGGRAVWIAPRDHHLVGECLEGARKRARITQQELAARLGKPQSFISAYENGQRRVDILEFLTIMQILGEDAAPTFMEIRRRFLRDST